MKELGCRIKPIINNFPVNLCLFEYKCMASLMWTNVSAATVLWHLIEKEIGTSYSLREFHKNEGRGKRIIDFFHHFLFQKLSKYITTTTIHTDWNLFSEVHWIRKKNGIKSTSNSRTTIELFSVFFFQHFHLNLKIRMEKYRH